ncbi:palmitoyl-protein thioesterase 1-like isoform X1 [Gossypium australe]|uniref:Palmitoyl-protein thioesterase 1-like isoform X1 n=1 Tax=Gossypium australe TaxID=47621 RepID=A0A5B6VK26_9ROSI|nr:palmitoyl-protein thioesterase 1-like isoform X1 [Gossypium australe]
MSLIQLAIGCPFSSICATKALHLLNSYITVKNFISLAGPHAGIASIPFCEVSAVTLNFRFLLSSTVICIFLDSLIKSEVYSNFVQEHLAPSGYLKIPTVIRNQILTWNSVKSIIFSSFTFEGRRHVDLRLYNFPTSMATPFFLPFHQDITDYIKGCRFLPKLNNEIKGARNSTYKERFASLQNLVLIMVVKCPFSQLLEEKSFEDDTVLVPKETSWFGYYPDGAFDPILPAQETELYKEDWIGLKTLDEAGKVKFINVSGSHLKISESDMKKYIVPYLGDQPSTESSSYEWLWRLWYLTKDVIGLNEDQPLLHTTY